MPTDAQKNFSYGIVVIPPSPGSSGTELQVLTGGGATFPAPPFNVTIWPLNEQPTEDNAEIARVTGISGDTITITRAQEGTTARNIVPGDQISLTVTTDTMVQLENLMIELSDLGTPIGSGALWFTNDSPGDAWLLLQGQAVNRTEYAALFALWGTLYGAGDGSTTFNIPDMRGRIPIGRTDAGSLGTLGGLLGDWDHTHGPGTFAVASHSHGNGSLGVASHSHGGGTLQVASHSHDGGQGGGSLHTNDPGNHSHTVNNHNHSIPGLSMSFTTGNESNTSGASTDVIETVVPTSFHQHTFSGSTSGGTSGNASPGTNADGGHTHGIVNNSGSTAPSVSTGTTGAAAPAVNSGSTGVASPGVTTGATAASNPPVLVVNMIVKAKSLAFS